MVPATSWDDFRLVKAIADHQSLRRWGSITRPYSAALAHWKPL